jgi:hypothetical protein
MRPCSPTIKVYAMRPYLSLHKGFKNSDQSKHQGGDQS